jgi:hypothetical protein
MYTIGLIMLVMGVSLMQGVESTDKSVNKDRQVKSKIMSLKMLMGWTGLSAASFTIGSVYNKWSKKFPENKERYIKLVMRYNRFGRIAALPFLSCVATMSTMRAEQKICGHATPVSAIAYLPLGIMVAVPCDIMIHSQQRKWYNDNIVPLQKKYQQKEQ